MKNNTPAAQPPSVTKSQISAQKARFTSRLLMEEHELMLLRQDVAAKKKQIQQLQGAIAACDELARIEPPDAADHPEPPSASKKK